MASKKKVREGVQIENLTVHGNKKRNSSLTGCRGAGISLYRAHSTEIRGCRVEGYHGDGISFQQSNGAHVEGSPCVGNTHLGFPSRQRQWVPHGSELPIHRKRAHRPPPLLAGQTRPL